MELSVLTLNLWGLPPPWAWPPRRLRFPRARRWLAAGRSDLVALQELWRPTPRPFARVLPSRTRCVAPGPGEPNTGLALAVAPHLRVLRALHRPFVRSARGVERLVMNKGVLHAVVAGVDDIHVVVTHLHAWPAREDAMLRAEQVDVVLDELEGCSPAVLAGDLNFYDDSPEDRATLARIERAGLVDAVAPFDVTPTYDRAGERERFDRIFVRGLEPRGARVHVQPELSDHRAVEARLALTRPAPRPRRHDAQVHRRPPPSSLAQ